MLFETLHHWRHGTLVHRNSFAPRWFVRSWCNRTGFMLERIVRSEHLQTLAVARRL